MIFSIAPFETSNILLLTGLLFVAGVAEDILDTWVTFTVVKRETAKTAIITFVGVVLEFTVFLSVISNLDKWPVILSYALGATVGSVAVIELQKRATRRKTELQKIKKSKAARRKRIARLTAERKARQKLAKVPKMIVKKVEVKKIEKVKVAEKIVEGNDAVPNTVKSDIAKSLVQSPI